MSFDGIICIDKPEGFTSFDVIAKLRGITRTKRVGHAGTLDPMATGVLPVFFGRAAKAIGFLPSHDKTYIAAMRLGTVTDTQDSTGRIITQKDHNVTTPQFESALSGFIGETEQTPPMYSAVKVNGRRLYDIARSGGEVPRTPRKISIYSLDLLEADEKSGIYTVRASCSGGTYIRTLCHDLGQSLGCGAIMTALRRTEACGFSLGDCITLSQAQALQDDNMLQKRVLPVSSVFSGLQAFTLTARQAGHFRNGLALRLSQFETAPPDGVTVTVYDSGNRFIGLAAADYEKNCLKIIKLFNFGED